MIARISKSMMNNLYLSRDKTQVYTLARLNATYDLVQQFDVTSTRTRKSHFCFIIGDDSHKFELQTKQKRMKTKRKQRPQPCIFQTGYSTLSSLFAQLQSPSIPSKPRKYEGDFVVDEP
mmetsp:Transcript_14159/g.35560  ORF Transcript_14159/g.35560 Transcript_14159/m.35560 type:complete len:119 (-) Transcript_14159:448-804(-)